MRQSKVRIGPFFWVVAKFQDEGKPLVLKLAILITVPNYKAEKKITCEVFLM